MEEFFCFDGVNLASAGAASGGVSVISIFNDVIHPYNLASSHFFNSDFYLSKFLRAI